MIPAYDEGPLPYSQEKLGEMLELCHYVLHIPEEEFFRAFIASGLARKFEKQDVFVLLGRSSSELLGDLYHIEPPESIAVDALSPEYWSGYALAYIQFQTRIPYHGLLRLIPYEELLHLYVPYHEMDLTSLLDYYSRRAKAFYGLAAMRKKSGLSQQQLSACSGVPVRTIRSYEQKQNDIRKASYETLASLADALHCSIEDIVYTI